MGRKMNLVEEDREISVEKLASLYALEQVKGWGPVKFRTIHQAGLTPSAAIQNPSLLPIKDKIGEKLQRELSEITPDRIDKLREFAVIQINLAQKNGVRILTYDSGDYPRFVYESSNPVPVLYVKGSVQAWKNNGTVAVVSSRGIRSPYDHLTREFSKTAADCGFAVVSGFAKGTDEIGHRAARDAGGWTICVMPCGVDKVFPPEKKSFGATSSNIIERNSSASSLWVESPPLHNCVHETRPLQYFLKLSWLHSQLSTAVQ